MPCGRASFPAQLIREDISEEVAVELGFGWVVAGMGERARNTGLEMGTWEWSQDNLAVGQRAGNKFVPNCGGS